MPDYADLKALIVALQRLCRRFKESMPSGKP